MRTVYSIAILSVLILCACSRVPRAPGDPTADNLSMTALSAPLPSEAFRAQISFGYEAPANLRTGERRSIHLLVKNLSHVLWPDSGLPDSRYELHLGSRWLDQNGGAVEDGRGRLSYDVRPGDTAEVTVVVNVPTTTGEYVLEFDMVQEYVGWFKDKGSEPLRVNVVVQQ